MDVGVRDTLELMYRLKAILSTANIAMPNSIKRFKLRVNCSLFKNSSRLCSDIRTTIH